MARGKCIIVLPLLLLSGCTAISTVVVPSYVPLPIHVYDQAQYAADEVECQSAGAAYVPKFSFGSVIARTFDGATSNASLIPLNPLVPAYGAAGGALGAASEGLDVMSSEHRNVFRNCLADEVRRDRSAIVADPRE